MGHLPTLHKRILDNVGIHSASGLYVLKFNRIRMFNVYPAAAIIFGYCPYLLNYRVLH